MLALQQSARFFFSLLFWIPVFACSLVLIYNTIPYFSFDRSLEFIAERSLLFQSPIYATAFYVHIGAGVFCIASALLQFSSYILKRRRPIHVWSGKIYVTVVLLLAAPTGLYMSFFAKGSFYERALFLFMAVFWFWTTYKGLTTIMQKKVLEHKHWMMRSYSMALTAVTFRVYHIIFFLLDWDGLENYEISLWISVIGNMLVAEWLIYRRSRAYLQRHLSILHH